MARAFGKAVIIGLGGTGQKALIRIKKMFLDHCGGELPPCIKLLAFDTSSNQEDINNARGEKITFDSKEFYHMRVGSIREAIKSPYIQKWWTPYKKLNNTIVNEGTGGIRQVGRLALFVNIDGVRQKIERAFSEIDTFGGHDHMAERDMELLSITPQVYVIGSFAGGTGSGSFVDFSILCRSLGGLNMLYSAFFVMPWVYRIKAKHNANENGYAALLELEQLNNSSLSQPYTVQYGPDAKLEFSLDDRPYHIVNLIDGKCRNGYKIDDDKELSQFIGECVFNSVGAIGEQAGDVVNNILTMIRVSQPSDWQNRSALYSTFGVSSIVYPGAEIHERASISYACDLIDQTMQHIQAPEALPLEEMNEGEIQPFIEEKRLEPNQQGLLKRILPEDALGSYIVDDQMLKDSNLKAVIKGDLDRWERRQLNECTPKIKNNGEAIRKEVTEATKALLERIDTNEQAGSVPQGSYEAANKLFLESFMGGQGKLAKEKEKQAQELDIAKDKLEACIEAIPDPPPRFRFNRSPLRIACQGYADARQDLLSIKIAIQKLEKAIELYAIWSGKAKNRADEIDRSRGSRDAVQLKLMDVKSALLTQRVGLSNENLLKKRALFEIYAGVLTEDKKDVTFVRGEHSLPSASNDFNEFLMANEITDRNSLDEFDTNQLRDIFMGYARRRLKPATDVSLVEILEELEKRKKGTIVDILTQAMRNSSLLLPIDDDKLAAKQNLLAEFTVIGGENGDELKALLNDRIPASPHVQNLWASTGDKYRITICNYFAAVPLHLLKDIRETRSAYLERLYPPAHTNVEFLFELPDVLPESFVENRTLRLLSLAMLEAAGLIIRKKQRDGTKFYKMDPKVMGREVIVGEEDLKLPGKPGKFYSLYEEVCKDETLQEKLEQALIELNQEHGFYEKLLEDMEKTYNEFKDKLEAKNFTKTITGNLYYQQAAFYREMLKNKWSIAEALEL